MKSKSISAVFLACLFCTAIQAKDYTVRELDTGVDGMYVFEPGYLHIQPGDSVRFAASNVGHQVQSFLLPKGAEGWSGGISQDITVKFTREGVYLYECLPHHLLGMYGVIQVGKAVNRAEAGKAAAGLDKQQVMNQGRLEKLMKQIQ
jgi:pseudoazurin